MVLSNTLAPPPKQLKSGKNLPLDSDKIKHRHRLKKKVSRSLMFKKAPVGDWLIIMPTQIFVPSPNEDRASGNKHVEPPSFGSKNKYNLKKKLGFSYKKYLDQSRYKYWQAPTEPPPQSGPLF